MSLQKRGKFHKIRKKYFEGTYYKMVTADRSKVVAVIPGYSYAGEADSGYSFIQIFDGTRESYHYLKFSLSDLNMDLKTDEIAIGNSHFSMAGISLDIQQEISVKGALSFGGVTPWPVGRMARGVMGPFDYFPFMECYYDILGLSISVNGFLEINGRRTDFSGGRGYIEKNWGRSFPGSWIWSQCNHFNEPSASLIVSVATIPYLGMSFPGFIIGLYLNGKMYPFTTYNASKITELEVKGDDVRLTVENRRYRLEYRARRVGGIDLKAPRGGAMDAQCHESLRSETDVQLIRKSNGKNEVMFSDKGSPAGLEINGDIDKLF